MKKTRGPMIAVLLLILLIIMPAPAIRALGPAPYPEGPVEFESYAFEQGTVLPGEVDTFAFTWNGINAASATLKITRDPKRPGYLCARAGGETIGGAALLYRAHDWVESCMAADTLKPDRYQIQIRESLDYYDMTVDFDHQVRSAHSVKKTRKESRVYDHEFKDAFCPVSLALLVRSLPWKLGDERRFEVVDGNDRWLMVIAVVEEREITTAAGTFPAVRLAPSIFRLPDTRARENAGWWVKQRKKDEDRGKLMSSFELWMAKDPPRPFLKGRSDVYFGHVDFELKSLVPGKN
jgi:hypothetical protein